MFPKLNLVTVQQKLKTENFLFFTPRDFARLFKAQNEAARKFIEQYVKKGIFTKLRNGLYFYNDNPPSDFLIANQLLKPSYVSLETALAYYQVIPETVYTVTSVTPKTSREFNTPKGVFTYTHLKPSLFTGYRPAEIEGTNVLIAEPEKALVDYLYLVDLKKRTLNERLEIRKLSKTRIIQWGQFYKRKGLKNLIKKVLC